MDSEIRIDTETINDRGTRRVIVSGPADAAKAKATEIHNQARAAWLDGGMYLRTATADGWATYTVTVWSAE